MNSVLLIVGHDPTTELGPALALGTHTGQIVRYFVPDDAFPRPALPADVGTIVVLPTIRDRSALIWARREAKSHAISVLQPRSMASSGTTYGAGTPSVWGAWVWTGQRWTWWELSIHDEPPEGTPPPGPLQALLALGITLGSVMLFSVLDGFVRRS